VITARFSILPLALLAAAALPELRPQAQGDEVTTLAVEGRSNQTPWVAAHHSFVAIAWGASDDGKADVFLAVSRDGGATFGSPVQVNRMAGEARLDGELPPRVALVAMQGRDPEIVVLWTARSSATEIKIARSRDGGRTFTEPRTLQGADAPGDRGWPALAVDGQGTAHAVWLDHRGLASAKTEAAAHDHKSGTGYDGVAMAQRSGLYYACAGSSTAGERELTAGVCYCCKTAIAVAADGAVYAAWRHVYPNNIRDIAMTVSRDGGATFATPVRVSDDQWQLSGCPDDGPALAIDASGTVHIVWPTVIDGATPEGALFYSTTRDGRRFTPRVRVPTLGSPKPGHPHIVADERGGVMVAWDEVLNGTRVAAALPVSQDDAQGVTFGRPIILAGEQSAMYPTLAVTADGWLAVWTAGKPGASRIAVRRLNSSARR
jgi:hypothetical protein